MNKYYLVGSAGVALAAESLLTPVGGFLAISINQPTVSVLAYNVFLATIAMGLSIIWLARLTEMTISYKDVLVVAALFAALRSFPYLVNNVMLLFQPDVWGDELLRLQIVSTLSSVVGGFAFGALGGLLAKKAISDN